MTIAMMAMRMRMMRMMRMRMMRMRMRMMRNVLKLWFPQIGSVAPEC